MLVSDCACACYIYLVIFCVRYLPSFVRDVLASGRCSVNVWGAISAQGLGPLVRLPRAFNAAAYRDLLDEHLLPYICGGPFPDGFFLFQQDLSPIHTARTVKTFLEERAVRVLDWPPRGADFNIIENVWGTIKHRMSRLDLRTATSDDLWQAVEAEWNKLREANGFVESLYESLPRRMAEAVNVQGAFTWY